MAQVKKCVMGSFFAIKNFIFLILFQKCLPLTNGAADISISRNCEIAKSLKEPGS